MILGMTELKLCSDLDYVLLSVRDTSCGWNNSYKTQCHFFV